MVKDFPTFHHTDKKVITVEYEQALDSSLMRVRQQLTDLNVKVNIAIIGAGLDLLFHIAKGVVS